MQPAETISVLTVSAACLSVTGEGEVEEWGGGEYESGSRPAGLAARQSQGHDRKAAAVSQCSAHVMQVCLCHACLAQMTCTVSAIHVSSWRTVT